MKKTNEKIFNNRKGITLLSLVVTIIILMILAGVSINMLIGENGILKRATKAENMYKKAAKKEHEMSLQLQADAHVSTSELKQQDIDFEESKDSLRNPDRGFYYPARLRWTPDGFDYESRITSAANSVKNLNETLVHVRIDISKLSGRVNGDKDKDLSDKDRQDLNSAFNILRENKLKAIVRISYDYDGNENQEPDSINTILKHIEQFGPVFEDNQDVITVVETGFIGMWGEMHDSEYANTNDINTIVTALLKVVPKNITVNVRTPEMYTNLFGNKPIDEYNAYEGTDEARVGIYNDGYLGNETDMGTYKNREEGLRFLESHAKYTIMGGEAVAPDNKYNDIENVKEEMFRTHTTYLNYVWNNTITQDKWGSTYYDGKNEVYKGETAYKYIKDHLGYRFVLKDSKISPKVKQGEKLSISISIENTGFANIVNEKKVQLILHNIEKSYKVDTNIDVRKWDSNKTTTKNLVFTIPNDIEEGDWEVFLKITDKNNEQYSIQFANKDVWNEYMDSNYIGTFRVEKNENAKEIGLKQEYADVEGIGTKDTYDSELKVQLDGKITNSSEWKTEHQKYKSQDNHQAQFYLKSDDKYLYLYVEDKYTLDPNMQTAIHIKFATKASTTKDDYTYSIENGSLYKGNLFVGTTERVKSLKMKKQNGYEYIIPLKDLEITGETDIKQIWIQMLDASGSAWNNIYNYSCAIGKEDITINVDGQGNEWTEDQLVAEKDGIEIYYYEKDEYAYLYCNNVKQENFKYGLVKYGVEGECYSIAYTSGTWNGTWQANDVNKDELYPWAGNASLKENTADSYSVQGENGIEFKMKLTTALDSSKEYTKIRLELFSAAFSKNPGFYEEFERKK